MPDTSRTIISRHLPAINAGLMCGCLGIIFAIADAALLFSGSLHQHISVSLGLCLAGGAGLALIGAWQSSIDGVIIGSQEITVLSLALMIAEIGIDPLHRVSENQLLPTSIAIICITGVVLGAVFFIVGKCRLGKLARFIPYPVIAGFLAGTGILIVINSISVILGETPVDSLISAEPVIKLVVGFSLAGFLAWSSTRKSAATLLPIGVLAFIVFTHMVLRAAEPLGLEADNWLISAPDNAHLWPPIGVSKLYDIHWASVILKLPDMLALAFVASLALMMKLYAIEKLYATPVDFNSELKVAGTGNLVVSLCGGVSGFHSLSGSALSRKMNGSSKLVGIVAGVFMAVPLLVNASFIELLPLPVFGAVLLWIGLDLSYEWLYTQYRKIPRVDFAIVLIITIIITVVGFTEGVAIGLAATSIYFIVNASRTSVVRHIQTGEQLRSGGVYSPHDTRILNENGRYIIVIRLHGHIFFGTAYQLEQSINNLIAKEPTQIMRHIIVDCKNVYGIDLSATQHMVELLSNAGNQSRNKYKLVMCNLQSDVLDFRESRNLPDVVLSQFFTNLNSALSWAEESLLSFVHLQSTSREALRSGESQLNSEVDLLLDLHVNRELSHHCEIVTVKAGEFLIKEGQKPDSLYIVEEGTFNILIDNAASVAVTIRSVEEGMIIGEMPLYIGGRRSATVQAHTDGKVWRLSYKKLRDMETSHAAVIISLHKIIAATLAARLKDYNRVINLVDG